MKFTKKITDKGSGSTKHPLSNDSSNITTLTSKWDSMENKDKLALTVLFVFLLGFCGVYGGYVLNQKVTKQQKVFDSKVSDFFWLRAQANNLKPASTTSAQGTNNQPLTAQLSKTISSMGINNPTVIQSGNNLQLSFEHQSQATISRAVAGLQTQLEKQGYQFSRLQINQNEQATLIKVQATVSSSYGLASQ